MRRQSVAIQPAILCLPASASKSVGDTR